jgi:glutamine cyclotransferase
MNPFKLTILLILPILAVSCGGSAKDNKAQFKLTTNAKNNSISNDQVLTLNVDNPNNHEIESISYRFGGENIENEINLNNYKLGKQSFQAIVTYNGKTETVAKEVIILSSASPKIYTYRIINEYPHDITSYTQGLEFHNGELYESTGQYGESKLRKVDYKTGEVLNNVNLSKEYFGEGLTIMNGKAYQLTWQQSVGFVYDLETFERESTFRYNQSKEGWGLCNNGTQIFKSDGTEKIWLLDSNTLQEKEYIQAYHNKGKTIGLNELEYINGKIFANRYQLNGVAIINPNNGAIEGVIDFSPLKKRVTQHSGLDVLNGLAWNPETNTLFVTGKRWDKIFEVEIVKK